MTPTLPDSNVAPPVNRTSRRRWSDKFREAFRGIKLGIRGHSSFFVHFFVAALVAVAAIAFQCSLIEWCILLGCIGSVLVAELLNSAIETLVRGLDPASRDRARPCLDVAAGAVLLASITSAVVGTLIFGKKLLELVGV
jgi:diacylglycerol kinase